MDERLIFTLRLLAFLAGSVVAAIAAMIVLLLISIFRDVGLPTAFSIQFVAGLLGGAWSIWKFA